MNYGVYETVEQWIPEKSRVLDLGTGDGAFLERLIQSRQVVGEGVEKDATLVARCVQRGLVVHQGDIADGLDRIPTARSTSSFCSAPFRNSFSPRKSSAKPSAWGGRSLCRKS